MLERFKKIRKHLKQNQSEFAKSLNTNQQGISDIERGVKKIPTEIIEILGIKYRINLNWLIAGEGEMLLDNGNSSIERPPPDPKELERLTKEIDLKDKMIERLEKAIDDKEEIIRMLKSKATREDKTQKSKKTA